MIRPFTLLCFCAFAGAGAWLYGVKHAVSLKDRELAEVRRQTETARQRIDILRAEWALLNEPERLRQTASRALSLEAMQPQHFVRLGEFERRLPAAVAFAGAPDLFAPPPGSAPVMLAAAPVAVAAALVPAVQAARPAQPALPVATPSNPNGRLPESPAPQALAAAVAAQRAEVASRAAQTAAAAPRPAAQVAAAQLGAAPARPAPQVATPVASIAAPRPIQPAVFAPMPPAEPVTRVARNDPPIPSALGTTSALGGSALGRPMLAPPVPVGSAQAATLDGFRPPIPR